MPFGGGGGPDNGGLIGNLWLCEQQHCISENETGSIKDCLQNRKAASVIDSTFRPIAAK